MTQIVNPSFKRAAESFLLSGTIDGFSGTKDYVVASADSPTVLAQHENLSGADLNGFDETTSTSSLNAIIDGGEAFVYGTWFAKDTDTTVSLAASTNNQVVYAGWENGSTNNVIIGLDSAFGTNDPKIPLWSFDTDGSGVTN